MPIELNALESTRFGIVAAKVVDVTASPEAIALAARAQGVQMLTVRLDVSDLPRIHALEAAGYQLMDTLVYYSRDLAELPSLRRLADGLMLRHASAEDAASVASLAREAFSGYMGHYHVDPRLNNSAADAAYVEWAETSTSKVSPDAPVLLAQIGQRVAGFLTLRRNSPDEMELVLSGIGAAAHGQGLYSALIAAALPLAREAGAERIITSTQINNYAVQRVWTRLGFFHFRSVYTMHKWF